MNNKIASRVSNGCCVFPDNFKSVITWVAPEMSMPPQGLIGSLVARPRNGEVGLGYWKESTMRRGAYPGVVSRGGGLKRSCSALLAICAVKPPGRQLHCAKSKWSDCFVYYSVVMLKQGQFLENFHNKLGQDMDSSLWVLSDL